MLDEEKRIVHAVSGHFDKAHRAGCFWLSDYVRVPRSEGDIVVTSNGGYPLDQNVYQAVKGMSTAESCYRDGGVIVMADHGMKRDLKMTCMTDMETVMNLIRDHCLVRELTIRKLLSFPMWWGW